MDVEKIKNNPTMIFSIILWYAENELDVDSSVKKIIIENSDLIKIANQKELFEIFRKIMVTNNPAKYIREFKEVFFKFIPELEKTYGFNQNNPWHVYDVFEHTMHVVENTDVNEELRIAALFHDIGKPVVYFEETKTKEDGSTFQVGHFYGHAKVSANIFDEFSERVEIPTEKHDLIKKLIIYHDYELSNKPKKIQAYIDELGVKNIPLLFALKRADNLSQNLKMSGPILEKLDKTEEIYDEYINCLDSGDNSIGKQKSKK